MLRRPLPLTVLALVVGLAGLGTAAMSGCSAVVAVGLQFLYERQALPEANVRRDLTYVAGPDADSVKHRLDLFLPLADSLREPAVSVRDGAWPTVVFVHGGGWRTGDKGVRVGGEDVYANVGRFFAARGIGAAVVSYRLMPEQGGQPGAVTWREQTDDVARAVAFVHREIARYGGDPDALFLMGHSAGTYLATQAALDPDALARHGVPATAVCGVIAVSGAGLDLTDRETYLLEDNFDYYSDRFSDDGVVLDEPPAEPFAWQRAASPIRFLRESDDFVRAAVPPFLILYAGGETRALQRQSQLLDAALRDAGASSELVVVPGQSHERIVLTLSRDDRTAGPAMLRFVRAQRCG